MECFNCGCVLTELDYCTNCGTDVRQYKKIIYTSNRLYNEGLERAEVRDLSGAVRVLRDCLRFNKNHVDARNLLGLIYYETGEAVEALSEWVVSANIKADKNIAKEYIGIVQSNQGRLDTIKTSIRKYNKALDLCKQDSPDLAVIQLKKVIRLNPNYVQARQLLALLYIQKEEWEWARKELEHALKTDKGNLTTLRYLKAAEDALGESADKKKNQKKKETKTAIYRTDGNETIIQPVRGPEMPGVGVFIQIGIGILIGVCVAYFMILPARISEVREELNGKAQDYATQIDEKNADITALNSRISELEGDIQTQKETINSYSGANGSIEVNNNLIAAAYAYLDESQDSLNVDSYLGMISQDYIDNSASPEFLNLYNYLKNGIGTSASESFYDDGIEAYNTMDYDTAIDKLGKAFQYDPENDDALYYLGLAYLDSGDVTNAAAKFNLLLDTFPDSAEAEKAKKHLNEINE
ncbi:MAG: tetratricopeptide repeat protein [Lachnospiraceae bacterium]|nr:tetratricopeptide repeat protein [Lachnospiraceae bacterium]